MSEDGPGIRLAWFHCFAGIAGDMALGSLLDAGADLDAVLELLQRLPISGWSLEATRVLRGGISATRAEVTVKEDGVARTWPTIRAILHEAHLPTRVEERASRTFIALAEAEASLHGRSRDQVHFHEIGGHDAIIDIVGTAAALESLDIEEISAGPVALGNGLIHCTHGTLPNPGPAVLALLAGAPIVGRELDYELTTPTGAAILAANVLHFGAIPAMHITATGYGAGRREIEGLPNCTQVVVGTATSADGSQGVDGQPLVLLEANVDDATGEQLADTVQALLDGGARDAWVTPVIMKKGRPGYIVSALGDEDSAGSLRAVLVGESGSFGVRSSPVQRWAATRETAEVEVEGHRLSVKVGAGRTKVEHDDAERVAKALRLPVREVIARAEHVWRSQVDGQA